MTAVTWTVPTSGASWVRIWPATPAAHLDSEPKFAPLVATCVARLFSSISKLSRSSIAGVDLAARAAVR